MRPSGRFRAGSFALVNGAIAIGIMTIAAAITGQPFIFPSLGPTVYLLYADPLSAAASPRNTLLGQAMGAAVGYGALVAFGLTNTQVELGGEITARRVGAAALALGVTSGVMVWAPRLLHPPATSTTLLVALGALHKGSDLAVLMLAVVLVVAQAIVVNRMAGLPYPWWSPSPAGDDPLRPSRGR